MTEFLKEAAEAAVCVVRGILTVWLLVFIAAAALVPPFMFLLWLGVVVIGGR